MSQVKATFRLLKKEAYSWPQNNAADIVWPETAVLQLCMLPLLAAVKNANFQNNQQTCFEH